MASSDRHTTMGWLRVAAIATAALTVAAAALAVLALYAALHPTRELKPRPIDYSSTGRLSYLAHAAPASIYGSAMAGTGEPLFLSSITNLTFTYSFALRSAARGSFTGKIWLEAVLENDGLDRTLAAPTPASFTGTSGTQTMALQLPAYLAAVNAMNLATGPSLYTLAIVPKVQAAGSLGGRPLNLVFGTPVDFSASASSISPIALVTGASAGAVQGGQPTQNPYAQYSSGSVYATSLKTSHIEVGLLSLPVAWARGLGAVGAIALFLAALATSRWSTNRRRRDPRLDLEWRFHSVLVPVSTWPKGSFKYIGVTSPTTLARLARRLETPILEVSNPTRASFLVLEGAVAYTYSIDVTQVTSEVGKAPGPVGQTDGIAARDPGLLEQRIGDAILDAGGGPAQDHSHDSGGITQGTTR